MVDEKIDDGLDEKVVEEISVVEFDILYYKVMEGARKELKSLYGQYATIKNLESSGDYNMKYFVDSDGVLSYEAKKKQEVGFKR